MRKILENNMEIKLIKSTFYKEHSTKNNLCNFIKKSNQLSMGEQCKIFEKQFAEWQGRKYCTMFNSGSSANLALIQALLNLDKLKKQDLVGFSGITWATNVMPLIQLDLTPIPLDINLKTLNCSINDLKKVYKNKKIKALFLTNLLGLSDEIDKIKNFCQKNKIILLEDNCESLGSEYKNKKLGNFGLASSFSFFVGHHLSTIEGGAVLTDNKELHQALQMIRAHGWDRNLAKKEQVDIRKKFKIDNFYSKYTFYDLGYNLRPTEINGFLGIEQLKLIDEIIKKREENFKKFLEIRKNEDFIKINSLMSKNSNFAFPVICKTKEKQRYYIKKCIDAGIEVRPIVGGIMTEQPFYKKYVKKEKNLTIPNSKFIHENGFYFGNNPDMTKKEIQHIINTLKYAN